MGISIKIRGKSYLNKHKNQTVKALSAIDVFVKPKEFVCLVGPSGCGKTTLMNIIGGLIETEHQEISINNKPLNDKNSLGYVFQTSRLLPWLTLYDNIKLVYKKDESNSENEIKKILQNFGLKEFIDSFPKTISGGMRRKVSLARAFVNKPEVLLMDEPFVSLDQPTTEELYKVLINYWEKNPTIIIFITHNLKEALLLGDRILFLTKRPGKIVLDYKVKSKRYPLKIDNKEIEKEYVNINKKFPNLLKGLI
ncbi:ATP-binding cassette domain-containing protein [Rickettsiales bacterium]|nr:ATP-binding cassette domain-containing protein [Rickettsiales bacterium]